MAEKSKAQNKRKSERKHKIINAAMKVFARKGFNDATIAEISKAAGISDVTLYEYFESKEQLLFGIPEEMTQQRCDELDRVLCYVKGAENRIRAIMFSYMDLYEEFPDYSSLVLLQLRVHRGFHKSKAYHLVRYPAQLLLQAIRDGIEEGVFRKDVDPHLIRSILLGAVEQIFTRWHLLGKPEHPSGALDPLLEVVLSGIRTPPPAVECCPCLRRGAEPGGSQEQD